MNKIKVEKITVSKCCLAKLGIKVIHGKGIYTCTSCKQPCKDTKVKLIINQKTDNNWQINADVNNS